MKPPKDFPCKSYCLGGKPPKDTENPTKAFLANPIGWDESQLRILKIQLTHFWQILLARMKTH